jgi:hypothetical protein
MVFNELDAFTAPRFTATGPPPAAERTRILPVTQHAVNIWNEGKFLPLLQIPGGVENVVLLHVDIPRTGGRGSDLPSEGSLQEYLKFPYEYFLSVLLPFEGYCCKLCPSNNPRRKKSHGSLLLSKHSTLMFCFLVC